MSDRLESQYARQHRESCLSGIGAQFAAEPCMPASFSHLPYRRVSVDLDLRKKRRQSILFGSADFEIGISHLTSPRICVDFSAKSSIQESLASSRDSLVHRDIFSDSASCSPPEKYGYNALNEGEDGQSTEEFVPQHMNGGTGFSQAREAHRGTGILQYALEDSAYASQSLPSLQEQNDCTQDDYPSPDGTTSSSEFEQSEVPVTNNQDQLQVEDHFTFHVAIRNLHTGATDCYGQDDSSTRPLIAGLCNETQLLTSPSAMAKTEDFLIFFSIYEPPILVRSTHKISRTPTNREATLWQNVVPQDRETAFTNMHLIVRYASCYPRQSLRLALRWCTFSFAWTSNPREITRMLQLFRLIQLDLEPQMPGLLMYTTSTIFFDISKYNPSASNTRISFLELYGETRHLDSVDHLDWLQQFYQVFLNNLTGNLKVHAGSGQKRRGQLAQNSNSSNSGSKRRKTCLCPSKAASNLESGSPNLDIDIEPVLCPIHHGPFFQPFELAAKDFGLEVEFQPGEEARLSKLRIYDIYRFKDDYLKRICNWDAYDRWLPPDTSIQDHDDDDIWYKLFLKWSQPLFRLLDLLPCSHTEHSEHCKHRNISRYAGSRLDGTVKEWERECKRSPKKYQHNTKIIIHSIEEELDCIDPALQCPDPPETVPQKPNSASRDVSEDNNELTPPCFGHENQPSTSSGSHAAGDTSIFSESLQETDTRNTTLSTTQPNMDQIFNVVEGLCDCPETDEWLEWLDHSSDMCSKCGHLKHLSSKGMTDMKTVVRLVQELRRNHPLVP